MNSNLQRPSRPAVALLAGLLLITIIAPVQALPTHPAHSTLSAWLAHKTGQAVPSRSTPQQNTWGDIVGFVLDPNELAVEGAWIDVYDEYGQPWGGAASDTAGYFEILDLPTGWYSLTAYPPPISPYADSFPEYVEVIDGQQTSTTLYLTQINLGGYVVDAVSPAVYIEDAQVFVYRGDGTLLQWDFTDVEGHFKFGGLEVGITHILEVYPPPQSEYLPSGPIDVVPTATNVMISLTGTLTNVIGAVHDPNNNPVGYASVDLHNNLYWDWIETDDAGRFSFRGIPSGIYSLQVTPPWDRPDLLSSAAISVELTFPDTLVDLGIVTLPYASKQVIGQVVVEGTGQGVPWALIEAWQVDGFGYAETETDQAGAFTLGLSGGQWEIWVEPLDWFDPWVFVGPPAWVEFARDSTPEFAEVTLTVVSADAQVIGRIVCPGGTPCPGDPPPDEIWVELRNNDFSIGSELSSTYRFTLSVPHGWYEGVVFIDHPLLAGPEPGTLFVGPGQVYDAGDVELRLKDAIIQGWVYNELGQGVAGVPVIGWEAGDVAWSWTETDDEGYYTMTVVGGEWFVEPEPNPDIPYIFQGPPATIYVESGQVATGVDFRLTFVNAHIQGLAVDTYSHERIWDLNGWAWTEQYVGPPDGFEFFSYAPMWEGGFRLRVRGNKLYNINLELPPYAPYVSGGIGPLAISPGAHITVAVPLQPKDALVQGQLFDVLSGAPALGVWAEIWGEDEWGNWSSTGVDPYDALFDLEVTSGTWELYSWVDPDSGYVAIPTPTVVTVESGQVVVGDIPVWPINASISGLVFQADGTPLAQAFVFAAGESPLIGYFTTWTESDESGFFELAVPPGLYDVGAALPGEELEMRGWMNPQRILDVLALPPTPTVGLELWFQELDSEIHGTVLFADGSISATQEAYVWAWSEGGEWAETEVFFDSGVAAYSLPVVSGAIWHVGATYEDGGNSVYYKSPEAVIPIESPGSTVVLDLLLHGPWPLLDPIIVSFDANEMQNITLPDGTELGIPPGALAISGTVTLYIFPTRELRPEAGLQVFGFGYEIWATNEAGQEITQFKRRVMATLHYPPDEVLAAQGILEDQIVPVYYSTLAEHWILVDNYILDTEDNTITFQVSHFSKFGRAISGFTQYNIYLPLVRK